VSCFVGFELGNAVFDLAEDVRILLDHAVVLGGDFDQLDELLVALNVTRLKLALALVEASDEPAQGEERGTERTERAGEDLQPLWHLERFCGDRGELATGHAGEHDGGCGKGVSGERHAGLVNPHADKECPSNFFAII